MSVGSVGGAGGAGFEPLDEVEKPTAGESVSENTDATSHPRPSDPQAGFLLQDLLNRTSHDPLLPEWAQCLDRAGHVRKLAHKVLADGVVTPDEVRALVDEAENDFFVISPSEHRALERMLEKHGDQFETPAREALAAFLVWKRDEG